MRRLDGSQWQLLQMCELWKHQRLLLRFPPFCLGQGCWCHTYAPGALAAFSCSYVETCGEVVAVFASRPWVHPAKLNSECCAEFTPRGIIFASRELLFR